VRGTQQSTRSHASASIAWRAMADSLARDGMVPLPFRRRAMMNILPHVVLKLQPSTRNSCPHFDETLIVGL
jgi:hypothetical protein